MPCKITPSDLAGLIAVQLGDMEADIEGRLQDEVSRMQFSFSNRCPDPNALAKIVNLKNILLNRATAFQNRIRPFRRMVKNLQKPLNAAKKLVAILKAIPIPTTVGVPPPYGGVIFSVPIKITNKYSELLRLACELVVSIENDIKNCNALLEETETVLDPVVNTLKDLDVPIQACSQDSGLSPEQLRAVREAAEGSKKEGRAGTGESSEVSFLSTNGKRYKLSVVTDPNSPSIAPKRFAIAKDSIGVTVLRGQSSFASSTEVLIRELKFRIDNQLP